MAADRYRWAVEYGEFDAERIKHMEMVQAVVSRLGTDSFLVKGWAVALTSALLGFGINGDDWRLAALAALPSLALWGLDTYYLRAERLFRALFEAVRTGRPEVEPFYLAATSSSFLISLRAEHPDIAIGWRDVAVSETLRIFYPLLTALAIVLAIFLHCL